MTTRDDDKTVPAQQPQQAAAEGTRAFDLSAEAWKGEHDANAGKLWRDSPQGRLAIRTFSRGILGCMFYAGGNMYAAKKMASYHPEKAPQNWVQSIARFFDNVAGKPIEYTVNALGYDGQKAVHFRPTRYFYNGERIGRTLGHEITSVTFDFACMSTGDATGRDIAGIFDPNAKLSWIKDGRIDYPQAVKSLAMSAWRIGTYHQGEDWAVALPYVYYLRAQRNLLNKFYPGFAYDSDRNLCGGSFRVNDAGKVVGNYNVAGLLDLQGRFTAYNIGTCMFREVYIDGMDMFLNWQNKGFPTPSLLPKDKSLPEAAWDFTKHTARWAARDAIKGTLYMTPAVPFFWITRTPQHKFRGLFIHPEKGAIGFRSGEPPHGIDLVHQNEIGRIANVVRKERHPGSEFTPESETFFTRFHSRKNGWDDEFIPVANPAATGHTAYETSFGPVDKALNAIGGKSNKIRKEFHHPLWNLKQLGASDALVHKAKRFTDLYWNAAVSYTPYFYTKAEFARLWDNGKMDQSVERVVDGITGLNAGEFSAGVRDVWNTLTFKPLDDPEMQKKAEHRILTDPSPADVFDPKLFDPAHRASKRPFVERLQEHKQLAEARMERFKQQQKPASHLVALMEQKQQAQQQQQPSPVVQPQHQESFVEQELLRKQAALGQETEPKPPGGITIH